MTTTRKRRPGHLSPAHPLADVAGRHCASHLGNARNLAIGTVACGACWERAIRDDERIAVEFGLPRELTPDPLYIDEIAVERACQGEHLHLTPVERAAAVRYLDDAGYGPSTIANRLNASLTTVRATLAGLSTAVPFVPTTSAAPTSDIAEVA